MAYYAYKFGFGDTMQGCRDAGMQGVGRKRHAVPSSDSFEGEFDKTIKR